MDNFKIPYKNLLSALDPEVYEALTEDIRSNGQKEVIEVLKDMTILDGHNRLKVCRELGIEPKWKITNRTFKDEMEIKAYIIKNQNMRRNDSIKQRVTYAFTMITEIMGKKKEYTERGLADILGISQATIHNMLYILQYGNSEDIEKLKGGESVRPLAKKIQKRDLEQDDKPSTKKKKKKNKTKSLEDYQDNELEESTETSKKTVKSGTSISELLEILYTKLEESNFAKLDEKSMNFWKYLAEEYMKRYKEELE